MKEQVIQNAKQGTSSLGRLNRLREELHHVLLQEADRKGAFRDICFVGGTALRILYGLDRFSEDLDFSTSAQVRKPFDFSRLVNGLRDSVMAFGLDCQTKKIKTERNVQSCFFVFDDLLSHVDRTFPRGQKMAIKFEIDTNPPAGSVEMLSPVSADRLYKVRHFELPSLFAGKLHAILCRTYTKGRDLYDFLWYMGRKTPVNVTMLGHAYEQTQQRKIDFTHENLQKLLVERFEKIDFAKAKQDVAPFLVNSQSIALFERTLFLDTVKQLILT